MRSRRASLKSKIISIACGRSTASEIDIGDQSQGLPSNQRPSLWQGWGGLSHPNSPAGGGGPGAFSRGILGRDLATDSYPHPDAPIARYAVADARHLTVPSRPLKKPSDKINPPPKTKPDNHLVISTQHDVATSGVIQGQILADNVDADLATGSAHTRFKGKVVSTTPEYTFVTVDGNSVVTHVKGRAECRADFTIQTSYGKKAKATDRSAYGRGTTAEDKDAGNVTLGFHESNHRDDYLAVLRSVKLPKFTGRRGMTEEAFKAAQDEFTSACDQIQDALNQAEEQSYEKTDEVGYKKSEFDADHPEAGE